MPVRLIVGAPNRYGNSPSDGGAATGIHIGLINNMADGALKATERQFLALLDSAANGILVHLHLYALPDIPRKESAQRHINRFYYGIEDLWDRQLDGLIMTGTEPCAPSLLDEPYWPNFNRVIDWAEHNTTSAVWSCLAAHAAALCVDGIARRPLARKRCGVFGCSRVSNHELTAGVPSAVQVPHSRWNDTPANELIECGYGILTQDQDGGADAFVKQRKSLFVFFQGHPEYEANTLLLEYRRDIGSYLRRERETYPSMPLGYFDSEATAILTKLQIRALSERREELLADFPTAQLEKRLARPWRSNASRIYGNWLAHLCARKERRSNARQGWTLAARRAAG